MTEKSTFQCPICLSTAQEPVVTRCGHLFCWPCLDRWRHTTGPSAADCPVCKGRLDVEKDVIPIYGSGCQRPSCDSTNQGPSTASTQGEHAFHQRQSRPTPEDIPGPRRSGVAQAMRPAALAGCPVFFLAGEYSLILMLLWLAFVVLYPRVSPWVRSAPQRVRSWLAQRRNSRPQNDETLNTQLCVNVALLTGIGLLLLPLMVYMLPIFDGSS